MLKIIAIVVSLLAALQAPSQADVKHDDGAYSNQTPYGNPTKTSIKKPPSGYTQVFLETLGRHGSRSQTSDDSEKKALAVWKAASKQGELTSTGQKFDDDLKEFQAAEDLVGYGKLSTLGHEEWAGIGRRTAANYRSFLTKAADKQDDIDFETTDATRTKQSADALRDGLVAAIPTLDIEKRTEEDHLKISSGSTPAGRAAIEAVESRSDVRKAARNVLRKLYSSSYVDSLSDPVSNALDIYGLYAIAAGMQGDTDVTFSRYVPRTDAKVLGYAKDADKFYKYGPGVKGETSSYEKAKPILKDFFTKLDQRLAGDDSAALFRLAHGETTIPFAALTKMPGSSTQASPSVPYSYSNNPWRGDVAGKMAGNIEWAAYRNSKGSVLVTIRYNEKPVKLEKPCKGEKDNSYFYKLSELKACLL
jgi:hypothetical protein